GPDPVLAVDEKEVVVGEERQPERGPMQAQQEQAEIRDGDADGPTAGGAERGARGRDRRGGPRPRASAALLCGWRGLGSSDGSVLRVRAGHCAIGRAAGQSARGAKRLLTAEALIHPLQVALRERVLRSR